MSNAAKTAWYVVALAAIGIVTGSVLSHADWWTPGGAQTANPQATTGTQQPLIGSDGLFYPTPMTLSQIQTTTPKAKGGYVACTNCATANTLCVSTGTTQGSFAGAWAYGTLTQTAGNGTVTQWSCY